MRVMANNAEIQNRRNAVQSFIVQNIPLLDISKTLQVSEDTIRRDVIAIQKDNREKLKKENALEGLLDEAGIHFNELERQYWRVYTTTDNDNAKLGALNGLTRCLGDKVNMLIRLGVIDSTEKHDINVKGDFKMLKDYIKNLEHNE